MAVVRDRIVKYEKLKLLGRNKTQAAIEAGYSVTTAGKGQIEKSATYKSVQEETQAAARELQVTPATVLSTIKRCLDRNKTDAKADSTSLAAAKLAADVLGMNAPQVVQTEVITKHQVLLGVLHAVQGAVQTNYTLVESEGGQDA
jgi:phage terminase small subunit